MTSVSPTSRGGRIRLSGYEQEKLDSTLKSDEEREAVSGIVDDSGTVGTTYTDVVARSPGNGG